MSKHLFLVGAIATSPLALISLFFVFNTVNPMVWAFRHDIDIVNKTDQTLFITPIQTYPKSGNQYILSQYVSWLPVNFPALREGNLRINPGKTITISYDWDDVVFSEVIVANTQREYKALIIDQDLSLAPPPQDEYIIASFSELSKMTPQNLSVITNSSYNTFFFIYILGILVGTLPCWMFYKWLNSNHQKENSRLAKQPLDKVAKKD